MPLPSFPGESKDNPHEIDLDDERAKDFKREEWIGLGKDVYELPHYVLAVAEAEMTIPPEFVDKLPKDDCPIGEFLALALPEEGSHPLYVGTSSWFSKDEPKSEERLEVMLTRPLLGYRYVNDLQQSKIEAWISGARSFNDVRYKNSRLPLCAVAVMARLSVARQGQLKLRTAMEWLESQEGTEEKRLAASIKNALETMGWNSRIEGNETDATTVQLTRLLSAEWWNDQILDMIILDIRRKRQELESSGKDLPKGVLKDVHLAPIYFGTDIVTLASASILIDEQLRR